MKKRGYLSSVCIMLLVCSGSAWAQERSVPIDQAVESGDTSQETVKQKSSPPAPIWPKPFKPSEEIGADSQISFPTDI